MQLVLFAGGQKPPTPALHRYEFTVTKKDVKITLVDGFSSDEPTGPFYIGNNKIMVLLRCAILTVRRG